MTTSPRFSGHIAAVSLLASVMVSACSPGRGAQSSVQPSPAAGNTLVIDAESLAALLAPGQEAPVVPLSDALALGASRRLGFDYGRVRSAGPASYILAAVAAGQAVALWGPVAVIWFYAGFLALTALAAARLAPEPAEARGGGGRGGEGGFRAPFRDPGFPWLLPLSALIQGSHALYYGFATIHWQAAGLSPGAGVL